MTTKDDGGPAFPVPTYVQTGGIGPAFPVPTYVQTGGMSLRDWFAGRAIATAKADGFEDEEAAYRAIAAACYRFADAMIAERKK